MKNNQPEAWMKMLQESMPPEPPEHVRKSMNQVCMDGNLNAALDSILRSHSPDGDFCILGDLARKAIEIHEANTNPMPDEELRQVLEALLMADRFYQREAVYVPEEISVAINLIESRLK